MTNNELCVLAFIITFIFIALKFIEAQSFAKNDDEENVKPLKHIFRDSIVVFFSACIGVFANDQISSLSGDGSNITKVFTNTPDF